MSVIAWDGYTLAADRCADMGGASGVAEKLFLLPTNEVVGFTGALSTGMELTNLYRVGKLLTHWPARQDSEDWARFIVGKSNGRIEYYERAPAAIPIYQSQIAWGSGQDFAIAAMHCGLSSEAAVRLTGDLCISCGAGVNAFSYVDGFWRVV